MREIRHTEPCGCEYVQLGKVWQRTYACTPHLSIQSPVEAIGNAYADGFTDGLNFARKVTHAVS